MAIRIRTKEELLKEIRKPSFRGRAINPEILEVLTKSKDVLISILKEEKLSFSSLATHLNNLYRAEFTPIKAPNSQEAKAPTITAKHIESFLISESIDIKPFIKKSKASIKAKEDKKAWRARRKLREERYIRRVKATFFKAYLELDSSEEEIEREWLEASSKFKTIGKLFIKNIRNSIGHKKALLKPNKLKEILGDSSPFNQDTNISKLDISNLNFD